MKEEVLRQAIERLDDAKKEILENITLYEEEMDQRPRLGDHCDSRNRDCHRLSLRTRPQPSMAVHLQPRVLPRRAFPYRRGPARQTHRPIIWVAPIFTSVAPIGAGRPTNACDRNLNGVLIRGTEYE